MGPCAIAATAFGDPQKHAIQLRVNGDLRQNGSTGQMIYPVAAIIEFITRTVTLHPGDIIATGTPSGVGMTTQTYLQPGDTVEAFIEGIGTLQNTMAAEA